MSKYTTEVRYICEHDSGLTASVGYDDVNTVLANSYDSIFDTSWEIFDENYRETLCTKILKHYYTYEICAETVSLWKLWLNERMGMIMPYYNKMYDFILLIDNPFNDIDYYDEYAGEGTNDSEDNSETNGTVSGTSNQTSTNEKETEGEGTSWQLYSDTPQGAVTGIEENTYLTNATKNTAEYSENTSENGTVDETKSETTSNTANKTSTSNNTTNYLKHVYGKYNSSKTYYDIISNLERRLLNIDEQIILELDDLFFKLW